MSFDISLATINSVGDTELTQLLFQVYVQAGYTTAEVAHKVFEPTLVRNRGNMFIARDIHNKALAGMIILVPSSSQASKLAQQDECEIHLLGVLPEYRGRGLGKKLVLAAIQHANNAGTSKIILWTQQGMLAAQNLYTSFGFQHSGEMRKNEIGFLVYEKELRQ